jgi:hypothetical protein
MAHARKEFEICCYSAVKDLLNKTGEFQAVLWQEIHMWLYASLHGKPLQT